MNGMTKAEEAERIREERERIREEREDARRFILDSIDAGVPATQILDELGQFFDGDPCDLF